MRTVLLYALLGAIGCALMSALFAPRYGNNPVEVAAYGFLVGFVVQGLMALLFVSRGWLR